MAAQQVNTGPIFDRDTVLHLRIPFSFFLMPVFLFGVSQAPAIHVAATVILFIAMHLFIYPASNVYNSYMDKDTGSIGGLEKPPPVTRMLYYASIIFDTIGILLSALAAPMCAPLVMCYVAFSKAYSWHGIRLKKYTWGSWLTVMLFQGAFTFMVANMMAQGNFSSDWFTNKNLECMLIASLIIGGSYPLTQIYQHAEDRDRGDKTLSYVLGIRGTFLFTLVFFSAGAVVALHYFNTYYSIGHFLIFTACILPVMGYFTYWFVQTMQDPANANFKQTMRMNKISSVFMAICFTILIVVNHR